ncbi:unnamed protein product [Lampetra fluviatilis]
MGLLGFLPIVLSILHLICALESMSVSDDTDYGGLVFTYTSDDASAVQAVTFHFNLNHTVTTHFPTVYSKRAWQATEYSNPVGMESKFLPNAFIRASSEFSKALGAGEARLGNLGGFWRPAIDAGSYIEVDFKTPVNVTGVILQGSSPEVDFVKKWEPSWVTSVIFSASNTSVFQDIQVSSVDLDEYRKVKIYFANTTCATILRLTPTSSHGNVSLRFEVLANYHKINTTLIDYIPIDTNRSIKFFANNTFSNLACYWWDISNVSKIMIGHALCDYVCDCSAKRFPLQNDLEFVYTFPLLGLYNVTVTELVPFASTTYERMEVDVNSMGCKALSVSIDDSSLSLARARTVSRKDALVRLATLYGFCMRAQMYIFDWIATDLSKGSSRQLNTTSRYVRFPPNFFSPGQFSVTAKGRYIGKFSLEKSSTIYINVPASQLVVAFRGADTRVVGNDQDLVVDAGELSYDPDDDVMPGNLSFAWNCLMVLDLLAAPTGCGDGTITNGSVFIANASALIVGSTMSITVTATKGNKTGSATQMVKITSDSPPDIYISNTKNPMPLIGLAPPLAAPTF